MSATIVSSTQYDTVSRKLPIMIDTATITESATESAATEIDTLGIEARRFALASFNSTIAARTNREENPLIARHISQSTLGTRKAPPNIKHNAATYPKSGNPFTVSK